MSGPVGPNPTSPPNYVGLPIQTASSTIPITVGWGRGRLSMNLIQYGNFVNNGSTGSGKGGKGGADYSCSFIGALCEGPIPVNGVPTVWTDFSTSSNLSDQNLGLFRGTLGQLPWGILTPTRGYSGIPYITGDNYDLGGSATLPAFNYEVILQLEGTASWVAGGFDADLALVIYDFLTNPQYGVEDFPASVIDTTTLYSGPNATTTGDNALQTWLRALGVGYSPICSTQEKASSILARWLTIAICAPVFSDKVLKFIPYGDVQIGTEASPSNGVVYLPNNTILANLTDDDFIGDAKEDPVNWSRKDPADIYNVQRMEYLHRSNQYNPDIYEARDESLIEDPSYLRRIADNIQGHEVCGPGAAQILTQLILQRGIAIRNTVKFKLDWTWCLLEPMDLLNIQSQYNPNVYYTVQITDIEEDDNDEFTITALEYPGNVMTPFVYTTGTINNLPVNTLVEPEPVYEYSIYEPNYQLVATPQIWVTAIGGSGTTPDPNWGGCNVWVTNDISPGAPAYMNLGQVPKRGCIGFLTANLATYSGSNPDTTNTLSVDLTVSSPSTFNYELQNTTPQGAVSGLNLALVDDELIGYETVNLTSTDNYNLTNLYRGLFGTTIASHLSGAQFTLLSSGSLFKYNLPQAYIGQTLYIKLQSYNIFNQGTLPLPSMPVTITAMGNGFPPDTSIALNGVTSNTTFTVPAGWAITNIYITNTTANAITGGIKIGTTSGASDVVNAFAVAANAYEAIGSSILKTTFSPSMSQTLYLQDVSSWNSASINVLITLQQVVG